MMVSAEKASVLQHVFRTLDHLAPLSAVLDLLQDSFLQDDVSVAQVATLIEKDAVLSAHVMRLLNLDRTLRQENVTSISHAVSLLGLPALQNLTLGLSVSRMCGPVHIPPGWSSRSFNSHAVAVAILSDLVSQRVPVMHPESAFLAGLFHDIGRLFIAVGPPTEYWEIQRLYKEGKLSLRHCELQVLGFTHCDLDADSVQLWTLPEPVRSAMLFHHLPEDDNSHCDTGCMRLSQVVHAANHYANAIGCSIAPISPADRPDVFAMRNFLTYGEQAGVLREFESQFAEKSDLRA